MTAAKPKVPDGTESKTAKRNPRMLTSVRAPNETEELAFARTAMMPSTQAAVAQYDILQTNFAGVELDELVRELSGQEKAVKDGNLNRMEAMLVTQAHTLDLLFNRLVQRGAAQMVDYPQALETYLKLAFRAQSNCRSTFEALAEIKNPKAVAFVQQANIAHGPQQVNNGVDPPVRAPARGQENPNQPNKLLEQSHGDRLDAGTAGAPAGADSQMVPVGAVNGAED